jgi:DNA-binding winged helix-turn-helix (wHTH) protein
LRAVQPPNEPIRFGVFELDPHSGELRRQGVRIKLQEQPLQLLQILLENPREVVTREALQKRIWSPDTFVDFDKGLYNTIKKLREALGDDASSPRYIETVPRRGYRFIAPVHGGGRENVANAPGLVLVIPAPDGPVDEPVAEPSVEAEKVESATGRTAVWKIAVVVGLLITLTLAGFWYWRSQTGRQLTPRDTIVLGDFVNKTGEAVFDATLKEGLSADLEQSTFLNILPDQKIEEELEYMGHSADTRLTPGVAREVCQRAGSKVWLFGSIAGIGSQYVLTLKAVNCENSELVDEEQGEADQREKVLEKLHDLATRLRSRLGESLASIRKNDTPLEPATTSSLEALQSYSLAMRTVRSQGDAEALPLYRHAVELDPGFALANADLGGAYSDLNQNALAREYATKGYQQRDKVSEWERFSIDSTYFWVTGQLEKDTQVLEAWQKTYPRILSPYVNLGMVDTFLGRYEGALETDLRGAALNPSSATLYLNLENSYIGLERLDDAEKVLEDAAARKLDEPMLIEKYQLAFLKDDQAGMIRCRNDAAGKSGVEDALLSAQSDTEAFHGRISRARELSRQATALALRGGSKETAAAWEADAALQEAEVGNLPEARQGAERALALASTKEIRIAAAVALARAGGIPRSQSIQASLASSFPEDTLLRSYWLPAIQAVIDLRQNRADAALQSLQAAANFELGGGTPPFGSGATLYPVYLRGEAYLADRRWNEAAVEYEKINRHRGLVWNSPLGALAWLQLGRAYAGAADTAKARAAYRKFLDLWSDADPGPTLRAAQSEYDSLH